MKKVGEILEYLGDIRRYWEIKEKAEVWKKEETTVY